ncbi:YhcN/YlaJ family sporulation lipoprotein [Paucisalibacillus globulus]|uniref:YhcN/YlaJ family sporulation lipoprotein n=1 Tax=Paucisalibacillus globulus TaxID=351095 RepID=UPI0003F8B5FC|nr:YhcN/YlaJ family sporulation lipoprotein [Paucisalibacillus globulus]
MKKHLVGIAAAALIIASGCGADNEEGQQGTTNQNIEPVRYQNNQDGLERNRNYTLQRDLEEPNRTDINTRNINNIRDQKNGEANRDGDSTDRYDVANEAAELITKKIDVIDNAYVLTTDNNAYVAAELDTDSGNRNNNKDGEQLTDDVKEQIAAIVKSVDHDIDNVYVSTNPDFMDLVNNYSNDIDNGEPVEGFFDEIGNMIERVFPQNR